MLENTTSRVAVGFHRYLSLTVKGSDLDQHHTHLHLDPSNRTRVFRRFRPPLVSTAPIPFKLKEVFVSNNPWLACVETVVDIPS